MLDLGLLEKEIQELLKDTPSDYIYHNRIMDTLEICVLFDTDKKKILTHPTGQTIWMHKEDWPLALNMCERFFTNNSISNELVLSSYINRLSIIREHILCQCNLNT